MNINIQEIRKQVGIGDEAGYWRARAIIGSKQLLVRLRAEHDQNIPNPLPKPVTVEPARAPKPAKPKPEVIVYPVIPPTEPYRSPIVPTVRRIQDVVAAHFEVTRKDIIGPRRQAQFVRPRMIAVYIAKQLTSFSTPQLGRFFGNKDHTTILHAERKIEHLVSKDEYLAKTIASLIERIMGPDHEAAANSPDRVASEKDASTRQD